MTDRELMQQALEALEEVKSWKSPTRWDGCFNKEITALRERLAQPEQVPVAEIETVLTVQPEQTVPSDHSNSHQQEQSPLDRMAENARELGLDYEPTGIAVRKVWWDGDTLRAEAIPPEQVYKQPEQEPVAWQWLDTGTFRKSLPASAEPGAWRPLYTTPQPNNIANSEAIPEQISEPVEKLWLWRNHVDGRPEYWAFDNPYPLNLNNDDPQTLGEPCGYAIFKESRDGSRGRTEEYVLSQIGLATFPPRREWVGLTEEEIHDCMSMSIQQTCRAIEAKLKEKNA